jgi:hypothetical protein
LNLGETAGLRNLHNNFVWFVTSLKKKIANTSRAVVGRTGWYSQPLLCPAIMHIRTHKNKTRASNQQPATSSQQPAASNQQPATSNQPPEASSQKPAASSSSQR